MEHQWFHSLWYIQWPFVTFLHHKLGTWKCRGKVLEFCTKLLWLKLAGNRVFLCMPFLFPHIWQRFVNVALTVGQVVSSNPKQVLTWHTSTHKSLSPILRFQQEVSHPYKSNMWHSSQHLPHFSATLVHQSTIKPCCYDIALYETFTFTLKLLIQLCFGQNVSIKTLFVIILKINSISTV